MRLCFITLAFTFGVIAFAQRSPVFAPKDRILTVEQWVGNEALVWAVQPDQIVIYRVSDTQAPHELVSVHPIGPADLKRIQDSISAIPPEALGKLHWHGGALHGPMVRLNFTGDGSHVDGRIEVCGIWASWLKLPLDAISAALPQDQRITFEEEQRKYQESLSKSSPFPPTRTMLIEEYYKPPHQAQS